MASRKSVVWKGDWQNTWETEINSSTNRRLTHEKNWLKSYGHPSSINFALHRKYRKCHGTMCNKEYMHHVLLAFLKELTKGVQPSMFEAFTFKKQEKRFSFVSKFQ